MKRLCGILAVLALVQTVRAQEILVCAASSMTKILPDIVADFEKGTPGVKVKLNFGSSGTLTKQILNGAPADVFFSASPIFMDSLDNNRFLHPNSRRTICSDELVLIAPPGTELKEWEGLRDTKIRRIAIGDPGSVAVGIYTKQMLTALKLWDAGPSRHLYADNVQQVLAYVDGGNVDAGIVYQSDAMTARRAVTVMKAPPGSHDEILMVAAVMTRTQHLDAAEKFVAYLAGPAQATFQSRGFILIPPAASR